MTKSAAPLAEPLVINGWSIYAHPVFIDQLNELLLGVEELKRRFPNTWKEKNIAKVLAAVFKVITEKIPANPAASEFRLGRTLRDNRKHWFRAK